MEDDKIKKLDPEWEEHERDSNNGGYLILYVIGLVALLIITGIAFILTKL